MAFDAGDLSAIGEIYIVIEIGRGPDFSGFQAAMALVQDFMMRGENPRSGRGRRWHLSALPDCS